MALNLPRNSGLFGAIRKYSSRSLTAGGADGRSRRLWAACIRREGGREGGGEGGDGGARDTVVRVVGRETWESYEEGGDEACCKDVRWAKEGR
jgi:hypothetical protein